MVAFVLVLSDFGFVRCVDELIKREIEIVFQYLKMFGLLFSIPQLKLR